MQLMPGTAAQMGVTNPFDPTQNINAGTAYLGQLMQRFGDPRTALVAYNWGPGNVAKKGVAAAPQSSQAYATKVLDGAQPTQPVQLSGGADIADWLRSPDWNSSALAPAQGSGDDIASWLASDDWDAEPESQPSAPQPVAPQAQPGFWDKIGRDTARVAGLTARAGVTGLTSLGAAVADPITSVIDAVGGWHFPTISRSVQTLENAAGLPQPENWGERIGQDTASALAGAASGVGIGRSLMDLGGRVAQPLGQLLSTVPGSQMLAATMGAGAAGVARENDMGPGGQLAASLLGGAAGAIGPSLALSGARSVAGAAAPIIAPTSYVGKQVANTIGADAADVASRIRGAQEFVPDSAPTAAQAGGSPALVGIEKAAANASPDFKMAAARQEAANNAARWDVIHGIAQDGNALNAAIDARAQLTQPLYEAAHTATATADPALVKTLQIPEVQEAVNAATRNATLDANAGRGVAPVWPTDGSPAINGAALDYTSRALGDMIESAKRSGMNSRAGSLTALQSKIDDWALQNVPGVADARAAYAKASVPINTMQAAQQMAAKLGASALDANGVPMMTSRAYNAALNQALKAQPFGIDSDALASLQGVGKDLQRTTVSSSLRSPGSDTNYNLHSNGWLAKQIYGGNFEGAPNLGRGIAAAGVALSGHPWAGAGLFAGGGRLGMAVGNHLNQRLGKMLLDPQSLLPYLDARVAAGAQQPPMSLWQLLAQRASPAVNGSLLGNASTP